MFVEVYLAVKPKSDFLMAAHFWLANELEWFGFQTSLFVTLTACVVYGNEGGSKVAKPTLKGDALFRCKAKPLVQPFIPSVEA